MRLATYTPKQARATQNRKQTQERQTAIEGDRSARFNLLAITPTARRTFFCFSFCCFFVRARATLRLSGRPQQQQQDSLSPTWSLTNARPREETDIQRRIPSKRSQIIISQSPKDKQARSQLSLPPPPSFSKAATTRKAQRANAHAPNLAVGMPASSFPSLSDSNPTPCSATHDSRSTHQTTKPRVREQSVNKADIIWADRPHPQRGGAGGDGADCRSLVGARGGGPPASLSSIHPHARLQAYDRKTIARGLPCSAVAAAAAVYPGTGLVINIVTTFDLGPKLHRTSVPRQSREHTPTVVLFVILPSHPNLPAHPVRLVPQLRQESAASRTQQTTNKP